MLFLKVYSFIAAHSCSALQIPLVGKWKHVPCVIGVIKLIKIATNLCVHMHQTEGNVPETTTYVLYTKARDEN